MISSFEFVFDFLNSLAIIAGLSWGYGLLRRRMAGPFWAPVLLGGLFGCDAVLQMSAPLEPVEGMIIDLRVVPVVLAGAFLGWRGTLVCLALAIPARIWIGGVGMEAGVASILLAAAGGLAWSHMTRHMSRRGVEQLIRLAIAAACTLFAGLLLPPELAALFYSEMALPLLAIYMIAVPLVGALLERERIMFEEERRASLGAEIDADTGLRGQKRFARDVAHATAAGSDNPVIGAIVLKVRDRGFLNHHWGTPAMDQLLGGVRHRCAHMLNDGTVIGLADDGSLLLSVSAQDWGRIDSLRAKLHRVIADGDMALPDGHSTRVAIATRCVQFSDPANAHAVIDDIKASGTLSAPAMPVHDRPLSRPAVAVASSRPSGDANRLLFARADAMLQARGA
jgi:hypothetical protein